MRDVLGTVDEPLSGPQALHLDEVCDRFEAAWKSAANGELRPLIEEYVGDTLPPVCAVLLHKLVLLEIDYRGLHGEVPTQEEYEQRFPVLSPRHLAEDF